MSKTQFKPGQSGNPKGRPSGTKQSARRLGANRLKRLLRALEPFADESINVAAEIMQDTSASQATRLKAAMMLLQKYAELTGEVYFVQLPKEEEESNGEDSDSEDSETNPSESNAEGKIMLFSKKN